MGPKERREREREETRGAILDAAREMFATEGYEAVTMRRIADRIEYSPTAIYFHFKDKEAVIRAICDQDFLALAKQFEKIARETDPVARIRKTGEAYARFGLEHPNHYKLMFMTPHPPYPATESPNEKGNPEEDAYAFLVTSVAEAIGQGRFRKELKDPHLVSQVVWSGVHGIVALEIAKCNDDWIDWSPMKKRIELMIDTLMRGLEKE
jgi:AcrR family transcriptional regulator